jgi:Flp pilus assembly protein TadD
VLRNLGVILLARGDLSGAAGYLEREERLYGETAQRHRALADLAYARGNRAEAAERYRKTLQDMSDGDAAEQDRRFLEARMDICSTSDAFESAQKSAALFSEGEAARGRGDADGALAAFLAAAEADRTNWPALNNAGVLLLEREDGAARALESFRRAAEYAPLPVIRQNIALAEAKLPQT